MKLLSLAAALVALAAATLSASPEPAETLTIESATHTVTLDYLDSDGAYRRATITIEPIRRDARPPWEGRLQAVYLSGLRAASARDVARAREAGFPDVAVVEPGRRPVRVPAYVPAPSNLQQIWLQGERGDPIAYSIWTDSHRPSSYEEDGDTGDDGDKDDDPDDDTDDDTNDDACEAPPGGCNGTWNALLCRCMKASDRGRWPWSDPATQDGSSFSFGI